MIYVLVKILVRQALVCHFRSSERIRRCLFGLRGVRFLSSHAVSGVISDNIPVAYFVAASSTYSGDLELKGGMTRIPSFKFEFL